MAASTATYQARKSDDAARVSTSTGIDFVALNYDNAAYFVAKHQSDGDAPKIRVLGAIEPAVAGDLSVVLNVKDSSPEWRKGLYDAHWEVEDDSGDFWSVPVVGGETLEILESLQ